MNQAGALVHVYKDGSIYLNHGGTEMGQGLFIKVAQVVANEFGVKLDQVKVSATRTSKGDGRKTRTNCENTACFPFLFPKPISQLRDEL